MSSSHVIGARVFNYGSSICRFPKCRKGMSFGNFLCDFHSKTENWFDNPDIHVLDVTEGENDSDDKPVDTADHDWVLCQRKNCPRCKLYVLQQRDFWPAHDAFLFSQRLDRVERSFKEFQEVLANFGSVLQDLWAAPGMPGYQQAADHFAPPAKK